MRAESKFRTFKELAEAGRREPNSIVAAVTSAGGTGRQALYLIERETGARFKFVTFKGGGEAVLATLGGHVELTTENMSEMMSLVDADAPRSYAEGHELRKLTSLPYTPVFVFLDSSGKKVAETHGFRNPREAKALHEFVAKKHYAKTKWQDFLAKYM